jgi:hypothetical protein
MKKRNKNFKLNKQTIASLEDAKVNKVIGGRTTFPISIIKPTTTLTDPTAATRCYYCPDPDFTSIN